MDCEEKAAAFNECQTRTPGQYATSFNPSSLHHLRKPLDQAEAHSTNTAASTETPNTSAVLGSDLNSAQDVLVGEGKYQAVSEGSIPPSGLSTVGDAGAGAGVVMTKVPH